MVTTTNSSAVSLLKKVLVFSGRSEAEVAFLTARVAPRKFRGGELIFGEAQECSGLYVIESGNVRILKSSASGREQVLSIDGPAGPSPSWRCSMEEIIRHGRKRSPIST
jgi:CRP/FNR family transcriptional regulator